MYKLKYVGSEIFPDYFVVPTYYEVVEVKNGIAIVKRNETKDRLLKEGFILIEEINENESIKDNKRNIKDKSKKETKSNKKKV